MTLHLGSVQLAIEFMFASSQSLCYTYDRTRMNPTVNKVT